MIPSVYSRVSVCVHVYGLQVMCVTACCLRCFFFKAYDLMSKRSNEKNNITIIHIYAPNIGASKYIQQILTEIKGEIDGNTVRVGDFNTHSHQRTDPLDRKPIKQ